MTNLDETIAAGIIQRSVDPVLAAEGFDAERDLFAIFCEDGTPWKVGEGWSEVLGWTASELRARSMGCLVHPDDLDASRAAERELRSGGLARLHNRLVCADGTYRWLLWRGFRSRGRFSCTARPLVEDEHAELALVASERRAHALLDAVPDGLVVFDDERRIVDVNRRACEIIGLPAEDLRGLAPPFACWSEEDSRHVEEMLATALAHDRVRTSVTLPHASGKRIVATVEISGRMSADGRHERTLCTVSDETEHAVASPTSNGHAPGEDWRDVLRLANVGSWLVDLESATVSVSEPLAALLGCAERTTLSVTEMRDVAWEADREALVAADEHASRHDQVSSVEWRFGPADAPRWAESRIMPVRDHGGRTTHLRGVTQEITARKDAELRVLRQAALLDAADAAIIATDRDGIVTSSTPGLEALTGIPPDKAVGRRADELIAGPTRAARNGLAGGAGGETAVWRSGGARRHVHARRRPLHGADGEVAGSVIVAVDITSRIDAERRLRGTHDFLTAVTDVIADGILAVDVGGRVTYMNATAERLLGWRASELDGQPLELVTGPISLPAGVTTTDDAVFAARDGTVLSVSFTASPYLTESGDRGTAIVFRDISARKAEQRRLLDREADRNWIAAIRTALDEDRFVLYEQPIVEIATGERVQRELLIRMRDDDGTMVAPGLFLPVAERTGLIGELDRWVVRQALELAADGKAIELNLSAHSVGDPEMQVFFENALRDSGADPELVVVELTETALLDRPENAERFVRRLASLGCKVALDDFGTGYGGFSYLKRLPVSYLKIDIEFVRDLPQNPASRTVVEAVVSLAGGFGQQTVAEGVEDDQTLAMLRDLRVDYAQGYGIGRPGPIT